MWRKKKREIKMSEWRHIDTAPRDGTEILVVIKDGDEIFNDIVTFDLES